MGGADGDEALGNGKNLAFWAILILLLVTLFSVFQEGSSSGWYCRPFGL